MTAVVGSGIRIMSDSLMPFQPAIDEPSNILPSTKRSSSTRSRGIVDVLFFAARVGEAEVDVLDLLVLDQLDYICGFHC